MKCFKRNLNPNNAKSLSKMSISHISKSIYQLDISPPKFRGQLNKDIRCSVAIIGGGLTGISTALSLSEKGYDPSYGARPLRRQIQIHVQNPLAEDLIAGTYTDGDEIFVDISDVDDGLIFHKQNDLAIIK